MHRHTREVWNIGILPSLFEDLQNQRQRLCKLIYKCSAAIDDKVNQKVNQNGFMSIIDIVLGSLKEL